MISVAAQLIEQARLADADIADHSHPSNRE